MNRKRIGTVIVGLLLTTGIGIGAAACDTDAKVVDNNISQDAENFKIPRRITFINGITDKYLLTIEGYCSLNSDNPAQLTVTCAREGGYIRDYLGKSDNVTWLVEQLNPARVSPNFYHITFKPETIIPDIELR